MPLSVIFTPGVGYTVSPITSAAAAALPAVAITAATALTLTDHANRHLSWSNSGVSASMALPAGTTEGDLFEITNDDTVATLTMTGGSAAPGRKLSATPGETFYAIYSGANWDSDTIVTPGTSPSNSQSAAYTLVAADAGGTVFHPAADTTPRVWTIPANASVPFPIGTVVTFDNDIGAGAITIAITSDTLVLVGAVGSTGSRTLAAGGRATAQKVSATRWRIDGNGLT